MGHCPLIEKVRGGSVSWEERRFQPMRMVQVEGRST